MSDWARERAERIIPGGILRAERYRNEIAIALLETDATVEYRTRQSERALAAEAVREATADGFKHGKAYILAQLENPSEALLTAMRDIAEALWNRKPMNLADACRDLAAALGADHTRTEGK